MSEQHRRIMALWNAVILQAVQDSTSLSRKTENQHRAGEARAWLNARTPDFRQVCEMAGRHPDAVRRLFDCAEPIRADALALRLQRRREAAEQAQCQSNAAKRSAAVLH